MTTRLFLFGIVLVSVALQIMAATRVLATAPKAVELGAGPVRVALATPKGVPPPGDHAGGRPIHVIVDGLRVRQQPGVLYRLYLNLPEGAKPSSEYYIGMLNFFDAAGTGDRPRVFTISAGKRTLLADENTITIVPRGKPARNAKPVIERIELVAE
jgi:hypothetical protein